MGAAASTVRGAPEGWHRLVCPHMPSAGGTAVAFRGNGGGFPSRSPQAGGAARWSTSAVCRTGRQETMRAEQNHDAWSRRGRGALDRTGRREPIREREAAASRLARARDGDGGFWTGSWLTNSRGVLPAVLPAVSVPESPFQSPGVLCGTAFSPTKPGFIEVSGLSGTGS